MRAEKIQGFPFGPCVATGSAASSAASATSTGSMMGDVLNLGANLWIIQNIKNPYTAVMAQNFTQGFLTGLFSASNPEAVRQRQLAAEAVRRQQQEAADRARAEQQARMDAMYARLNAQLKLDGHLAQLVLKSEGAVGSLAVKLDNSDTGLKLKTGDDTSLKLKLGDEALPGYGIQGLPGIYVGGPAQPSDSGQLKLKVGDEAMPGYGIPGLPGIYVGGPSDGVTAASLDQPVRNMGIAGLPGIYLNDVDPKQAAQVAASAATLDGVDRRAVEDAALEAARKNLDLTAPSSDPAVLEYQKEAQAYQAAAQAQQEALQKASEAEGHVQADQAAIEYARSQLAVNTSESVKQAFQQMLDAGQSDENMAAGARDAFESAEAGLSIARTRAVDALARTAEPLRDAVADRRHEPAPLEAPAVTVSSNPVAPAPPPLVDTASRPAPPPEIPAMTLRRAEVAPVDASAKPVIAAVNLTRVSDLLPLPQISVAHVDHAGESQRYLDEINKACEGSTVPNCAFIYAERHRKDIPELYEERRNVEHGLLMYATCMNIPGAEWTVNLFGRRTVPAPVTTNILAFIAIPGYSAMKVLSNASGSPKYVNSPATLEGLAWEYKGLSDCLLRKPFR